jgi:nitroreductase
MTFHDALNWRYATKKMNGENIPAEKSDKILEAIRMAPTSMGLQPFKVFTVEDEELRKEISSIAGGQTQIMDSSRFLVFAAWDKITEEQINEYLERTASERDLPLSELEPMKNMLESVASKSSEEIFNWSARQTYIALGFGLAAAAVEEIDSTPMEGFNNQKMDELLDLQSQNMRSVSILALGYRDEENDWLAPMKKVRRPKEDLFQRVEIAELV